MWSISPATRIYLARGVTDLRKSFNGLYACVTQVMGRDPLSGHLFVFCNRRRTRIKIFYWDGSGFWVCGKRLERGRYSWPAVESVNAQQLTMLVGGIDLKKAHEKKWHRI